MSGKLKTIILALAIGAIAAPVAQADAYRHPGDYYRPGDVYRAHPGDVYRAHPASNTWSRLGY
jgi:hypothetical protein